MEVYTLKWFIIITKRHVFGYLNELSLANVPLDIILLWAAVRKSTNKHSKKKAKHTERNRTQNLLVTRGEFYCCATIRPPGKHQSGDNCSETFRCNLVSKSRRRLSLKSNDCTSEGPIWWRHRGLGKFSRSLHVRNFSQKRFYPNLLSTFVFLASSHLVTWSPSRLVA